MTHAAHLLQEQQSCSTATVEGIEAGKHTQCSRPARKSTFPPHSNGSRKAVPMCGNLCDFGVFELNPRPLDSSNRSVSFAPNLITTEVEHPFAVEDIASAQWYDEDELQTIRRECEETVDILRNDGGETRLPEDQYCKRGLESYYRKDLSSLRRTEEIRNDVLDAQVDFWCSDRTNSMEDLAEIYSLHSTQYAIKALVTGLHDWKSVQDLDQAESSS